jgi:hypothetical protein
MKWIEALVHVLVLNLVPLWGFTQESWSPGTTLALYWLQTLVGIPVIAALIVFHRRATRKAGHFVGTSTTTDSHGNTTTRKSTFLEGFLFMSVPFTIAHGIFLAFLLGMLWKDAKGAIDFEDLRTGMTATLNIMGLGFAIDLIGIRNRTFAWIELRAGTILQRTLVVHLAIILGMGLAALTTEDAAPFFAVFLVLKLLMDVLAEMPTWDPKEPPAWLARMMNRLGRKDDKTEDFAAYWRQEREERRRNAELAEQPVDPRDAARR